LFRRQKSSTAQNASNILVPASLPHTLSLTHTPPPLSLSYTHTPPPLSLHARSPHTSVQAATATRRRAPCPAVTGHCPCPARTPPTAPGPDRPPTRRRRPPPVPSPVLPTAVGAGFWCCSCHVFTPLIFFFCEYWI
jgi:hypothetical protein